MGMCGSKTLHLVPVPILDSVPEPMKKEDPSLGSANLSILERPDAPLSPRHTNSRCPLAAVEGLNRSKETVVLLTGASSWVGGHVAQALIDTGYSVRAAVSSRSVARVDFLRDMGCALVLLPDLLAEEGWAEAMAGCAAFAHVTSLTPSPFQTDADEMIREAVEGTELAMRFAAEAGTVRRVVVNCGLATICGSQRDSNPDHLWSEVDKNDAPETAFSKSRVAGEAKLWELAEKYKDKFSVCTVHSCTVVGALLPGQRVSSSMVPVHDIAKGKVMSGMFAICDAGDFAAAHVAGLERPEAAGQRYLVSSADQSSTLEVAEWAAAAGASGVDLAAWAGDAEAQKMVPKRPSIDNRKVLALLGRALIPPATSVARAVTSLIQQGLIFPHKPRDAHLQGGWGVALDTLPAAEPVAVSAYVGSSENLHDVKEGDTLQGASLAPTSNSAPILLPVEGDTLHPVEGDTLNPVEGDTLPTEGDTLQGASSAPKSSSAPTLLDSVPDLPA